MKSREIRKVFRKYFTSQDHLWTPSSSLIPTRDPSLLFVNAGMNQFKDYFLGIADPPHPQVFSIQKCMRAGGKHNDLEQVGTSPYHHTFFEMMGYFSFGGYSKKEALYYAFHFLTKYLNIPINRLWVSVFKNDLDTANFWKKNHQIPSERIFFMDEKDNFWRMGKTGPCGPCSEIYYYKGLKKNPLPQDMVEVWNLVFMEFNEDLSGQKLLPTPCIDTGMGLERITAILQETPDNYHTDLFKEIIHSIEKESNLSYFQKSHPVDLKKQTAFRVIADHSRAISFLIAQGVYPGNIGPNYVLRRLIRRACFYNNQLTPDKNLLAPAIQSVIHLMSEFYPELSKQQKNIKNIVTKELHLFSHSLEVGKKIFYQKIKTLKSSLTIPPTLIWDLYSTYGLPIDITCLMANQVGLKVPNVSLNQLKKDFEIKNKKTNSLFNKTLSLHHKYPKLAPYLTKLKNTQFTGYQTNREAGQIQLIFCNETFSSKAQLTKNQTGWVVLDRSCLYPEGGGAISDTGYFQTKRAKAKVLNCQKLKNFIFHQVYVEQGSFNVKEAIKMTIDCKRRHLIATSHSATHLLNWSLRSILGNQTQQMGSLVEPGKLRFDFNCTQALSLKTLREIEKKVTENIKANHKVFSTTHSYLQACKMGALSLESETYQNPVRVIHIGKSLELCGGIHVQQSGEIIGFKIATETSVKSGVRRITAYTADLFTQWKTLMETQNRQFRKYLNLPVPKKPELNNPFIHWMIKKETKIKTLKQKLKAILKNSSPQTPLSSTHQVVTKPTNQSLKTSDNFLVRQNEELREYLKIPPLKDLRESKDFWIPFAKKKEQLIASLEKQLKKLSATLNIQELIKKAISFQVAGCDSLLFHLKLSLNDTKLLTEVGRFLQSKVSKPCVILILGQGATNHPLLIMVSQKLTPTIHAGKIFKTLVIPSLQGKGGGNALFAQGIILHPSHFNQLEKKLLKHFGIK